MLALCICLRKEASPKSCTSLSADTTKYTTGSIKVISALSSTVVLTNQEQSSGKLTL